MAAAVAMAAREKVKDRKREERARCDDLLFEAFEDAARTQNTSTTQSPHDVHSDAGLLNTIQRL